MPMTHKQLGTIVRRIFVDKEFVAALNEDPVKALKSAGYKPTAGEAKALRTFSETPRAWGNYTAKAASAVVSRTVATTYATTVAKR